MVTGEAIKESELGEASVFGAGRGCERLKGGLGVVELSDYPDAYGHIGAFPLLVVTVNYPVFRL